jgi:hypothetical protein
MHAIFPARLLTEGLACNFSLFGKQADHKETRHFPEKCIGFSENNKVG